MTLNQFSDRYNLQIDFMQYFSVRTAVLNYIRKKEINIGPVSLATYHSTSKLYLRAIKAVEICI